MSHKSSAAQISSKNSLNYGGFDGTSGPETWEGLLMAANLDFVSVLVLRYTGVAPGSTYCWMLAHSLEKYLKSYLLKCGHTKPSDLRKYGKNGHGIDELWREFKSKCNTTTSKPDLNSAFDKIIEDISTITVQMRYGQFLSQSSDSLLYFYTCLCSFLRYLIIGKQKYRSTLYGLDDAHFLPMNYSPMSYGYSRIIVEKMLHIIHEHAGTFTNLGFVNQMSFRELSISNTAIMQTLPDCPICKKLPTDQISMILFYRELRPRKFEPTSHS